MFNLIEKDGKQVLTNGHVSADCQTLMKIIGILKELSVCNCKAEISEGVIWLEDGSYYNIKQLVEDKNA